MPMSLYPTFPVLIIDDEPHTLKSVELALKTGGIRNILCCSDSREVKTILADRKIFAILLDLNMPHVSGQELLTHINDEYPDIPTIVVTGYNDAEVAVQCMKHGAFDYMVKPVEKNRLVSGVRRAIEIRELKYENYQLKQRVLDVVSERSEAFTDIVTNNRQMLALFRYIESIAPSPQPVLIIGETGVGKELIARAIHRLSGRQGALISVNAAGIDDTAFADTLFGHVKGAFTGAELARKGLIEKAAGGTMVLDEIGDLSMDSQIKLLRLIQEGEYYPLGSDLAKLADARIIVSTNQNLAALQEEGRFRKDLYFRLRSHRVEIPPLRQRPGDIPLLLEHFLEEAAKNLGKQRPTYPPELLTLLANYSFPGNIRELRGMVYDALSTHKTKMLSMQQFQAQIDLERSHDGIASPSLPAIVDAGCQSESASLPTLKAATDNLILLALQRCNNNQSLAAKLLGISRQRLARHLRAMNS